MKSDSTDRYSVSQTVTDGVYRLLVEAILYGDLASSSRLILQDLAEKYQVSLSPVREALQRLATEGFIEATPRRGYRIRKPSARHVTELWQVRVGLEITAGELLIERMQATGDRSALQMMEKLQTQMESNSGMTHREHIELNTAFHKALIDGSGNQLLANFYHSIQMQLLGAWVQRGVDDWRLRLKVEGDEHRALLQALKERRTVQLAAAIRGHLGRSLQSAINDLLAQPEPAEDRQTSKALEHHQRQGTTQ